MGLRSSAGSPPNLVLCVLPAAMVEACIPPGDDVDKILFDDAELRDLDQKRAEELRGMINEMYVSRGSIFLRIVA